MVIRPPLLLPRLLVLPEHGLQGLNVADGVAEDLHLGQALVGGGRRLLAEGLESLVYLRK